MKTKDIFLNDIDTYKDSILAILGFINFYLFDDISKTLRNDVFAFQGRRFDLIQKSKDETEVQKVSHPTPDIAILLPNNHGVIGEVKLRFPRNQDFWENDFKQVFKYDNDLIGWPTEDQKVFSHEVVLILHESQEVLIRRYYEANKVDKFQFIHPFIIINFHRTNQRNSYAFFQIKSGNLSDNKLNDRLEIGIEVPLSELLKSYSEIKLYDAVPPLPYLLKLIWQDVVAQRVFSYEILRALRRKQKIKVELKVDEIIEELHNSYSFKEIHKNYSERQSIIPKREWVIEACEKLIEVNEAEWLDEAKTKVKIYFQKHEDILGHFIEICANIISSASQIELFNSNSKI